MLTLLFFYARRLPEDSGLPESAGYSRSLVQFMPQFGYIYNKPGTNRAVFVGTNRTKDAANQVISKWCSQNPNAK